MNERLLEMGTYPFARLEALRAEMEASGTRIFDFGTGDPREPTPSFVREAFRRAVPEVSQYPRVMGTPGMRRAAAGYLRRRFGVDLDPDREILPTQGSKEAIFHLPMVLVDPSSERNVVVYGVPAYPVFRLGALFAEARIHEVALGPGNGYLLAPEAVPAEILDRTAVVFLNYPHNPTGQVMPGELFAEWVAARERHGFVLVSDECYVDLYYEGAPPHSVVEFGRRGCLAVHSLSKRSGMTGYRSGFLAGDAELIAHYARFRAGMGLAPPLPTSAAAEAAWAEPEHVEARRSLFAAKRQVLLERFRALDIEVWPGPSTLFLWARVPGGRTDHAYAEELLRAGILVSPGSFFGPGQETWFRVALVPSLPECREAAALWVA